MLFDILAQLAIVAVGVSAALEPCEPPTSTSKPPTTTPTPPPSGGGKITTLKNRNKCMDLNAANYNDGTKVQLYDCNGTGAQNWNMKRGSGHVTITGNGKTLCLDAGTNPHDGSLVKVWTCYNGLQQQQWYYTNDNRLALDGLPYCLDLPSGNTANGQQLQIWTCSDNNPNQDWRSTLAAPARRRQFARQQIAEQLA